MRTGVQQKPESLSTPEASERTSFCQPESLFSERCLCLAVFVLTVGYISVFRRFTTIEPDEGILLQGAQRILSGQVMYRDFFSFLTPGSFYLHAALFRIFGNSLTVARTWLLVNAGIFSVLFYLLSRRVCSRLAATIAVALLTMTTVPFRFLTLHNWDSTLLACLGVYSGVRALESRRRVWIFALASFVSITTLFEQSKGVGLGLGVSLGFVVLGLNHRLGFKLSDLKYLAAGLVWPFLVTLGYFMSQHAIGTMLSDWLWPLHHYSAANHVRYGYSSWSEEARYRLWERSSWPIRVFVLLIIGPTFLIPVLPLAATALFCYWGFRAVRGDLVLDRRTAHYCLLTGVLTGLLLSIVAVRADVIHFMYLQPLYGLLLAWILDGRDIPGRWFKSLHPALSVLLALSFAAFAIPLLMRASSAPYRIETRRGEIKTPAQDTVLPFIQAHVGAGSSLLVYPYLPLYNYLTETVSPVAYDYFQPGMNTAEQAQQILSELKSGRIRFVLFEPGFAEKIPSSWPGTPEIAIANDPAADYIASHYRNCQVLHSPEELTFLFMVRKEDRCP